MPLTPRSDDPNRKKEIARKKADPHSFGTDGAGTLPPNWKPGTLATEKKGTKAPSVAVPKL